MTTSSKPGFTLIELLVVIAIIGILSTLAIIALGSARQKARDSKRVADINQIGKAMELFYSDNNLYPTNITPGQPITFGSTTYLSTVPSNPTPWNDNTCPNQNYAYTSRSDNQGYTMYYCLGSATGQAVAGANIATESSSSNDPNLVLRLDAGISASYPGSGTAWTDLSGKNYNGVLTNGPTYDSANGGSIVFDGVNDYAQLGSVMSGMTNFTIIAWVKSNQSGIASVFANYGTSAATGEAQFVWSSSASRTPSMYLESANIITTSGAYVANAIKQVSVTRSGATATSFVDGVLKATSPTAATTPVASANFRIGANRSGSELFAGNVYQILVYNRALSTAEILANYNAQKARYGL